MKKKVDKTGRHTTSGSIGISVPSFPKKRANNLVGSDWTKVYKILIENGLGNYSAFIIAILEEGFDDFPKINLAEGERKIQRRPNKSVLREIELFEKLLTNITEKGKSVNYFKIGLENERPTVFKVEDVLKLVRVALFYFTRMEMKKELINEIYLKYSINSIMIRILFDTLKKVSKKSDYSCRILTYDILIALDLIIDDGYRTDDEKSATILTHTASVLTRKRT